MKIGQIIKERYEILEVLGEGGMAFVYKAMDTQLERFVAIKTLKPNYVNQETFVERFRREAKTAANLNHPNIVQIFDWGIEEEPFFVMEYIEGNIKFHCCKNRTISLSDAFTSAHKFQQSSSSTSKRSCTQRYKTWKYNDYSRWKGQSN